MRISVSEMITTTASRAFCSAIDCGSWTSFALGKISTSLTRVHEQEEHENRQHVDHRHEVDLAFGLVPLVMPRHARGSTHEFHCGGP